MQHPTKDKTREAIGRIIPELLTSGIRFALPMSSDELPFHIIIIFPDCTIGRMLVRYRSVVNGKIEVQFKEPLQQTDYIGIYCPELQCCFYLKAEEVTSKTLTLQLNEEVRVQKNTKLAFEYVDPTRLYLKEDIKPMFTQTHFSVKNLTKNTICTVYEHQGKKYIEGSPGDLFSVVLNNTHSYSDRRKMKFVVTVDGKNIISGKDGSIKGMGYVIKPYQSAEIKGWRVNDNEVAQFYFTSIEDSYSSKLGDGSNVGVIAAAVFNEIIPAPVIDYTKMRGIPISATNYSCSSINASDSPMYYGSLCSDSAGESSRGITRAKSFDNSVFTASVAGAAPATEDLHMEEKTSGGIKLGTGFGESQYSPTREIEMEVETTPFSIYTLFYETRESLIAKGIIKEVPADVNPFPADSKYCPVP